MIRLAMIVSLAASVAHAETPRPLVQDHDAPYLAGKAPSAPPERPQPRPEEAWTGFQLGLGIGLAKDRASCPSASPKASFASFARNGGPKPEPKPEPCVLSGGQFFEIGKDEDPEEVLFARYLHDTGRFVWGGEVGYQNDQAYIEAQAGYDMGDFLPYVGAGSQGAVAGVDYRISERWIFGVKAVGLDDTPQPQIRLSLQF